MLERKLPAAVHVRRFQVESQSAFERIDINLSISKPQVQRVVCLKERKVLQFASKLKFFVSITIAVVAGHSHVHTTYSPKPGVIQYNSHNRPLDYGFRRTIHAHFHHDPTPQIKRSGFISVPV